MIFYFKIVLANCFLICLLIHSSIHLIHLNFIYLICFFLQPLSQIDNNCSKHRWAFFEVLGNWLLLLKLTEVIVNPSKYCYVDNNVTEEDHASAAVQVIQDLVEKLSIEDTGEILLQSLGFAAPGHTASVLDLLSDTAASVSFSSTRRKSATRLLCFLLKRSAECEIMCIVSPSNGLSATPSYVSNNLYPLRSRMLLMLSAKFAHIADALYSFRGDGSPEEGVQHPGYKVNKPFSVLRSNLVELVVLLVESDASIAESISSDLWKELISWLLTYAHNNVYHNFFYRLLFAVLR